MTGFSAILFKEISHIRRDRITVFFTFVVPALEMTIFGFAIDVTIEHIPLCLLNLDGRLESRRLIDAFESTGTFVLVGQETSWDAFQRTIRSGRARAGLVIPPDYSEKLSLGRNVAVELLIDGSDAQVATTALNASSLLITRLALAGPQSSLSHGARSPLDRGATDEPALPIELRPRLLFNAGLQSSHFFVPGLIGIILQLVLLFLTSFSIVRERELGTLEQLYVTPVSAAGLLFGKLIPYAVMAFGELLLVLILMVGVFGVHIVGQLSLLLGLSAIFIVTALGLGLLISTVARNQLEAIQTSFIVMLPSVLLSGFMFPRSEMPTIIYWFTFLMPVTYFVEILRGVILRGADLYDLVPHVMGLLICMGIILSAALLRFTKRIA